MRNLVEQIQSALTPSSIGAEGRKLDNEQSVSMTIEARNAGPAAHTPDTETVIGTVEEVVRIAAPPDDGRTDPPSIWNPPAWMTSGERW